MKKYIAGLAIAVVSLFLVTGCGTTDKLTCTASEEEAGIKTEAEIVTTFGANGMEKVVAKSVTKPISEEGKTAFDAAKPYLGLAESNFEEVEGVTFNSEITDDSYTVELIINPTKIKSEDYSKVGMDAEFTTYTKEAAKADLEAEGYTCK